MGLHFVYPLGGSTCAGDVTHSPVSGFPLFKYWRRPLASKHGCQKTLVSCWKNGLTCFMRMEMHSSKFVVTLRPNDLFWRVKLNTRCIHTLCLFTRKLIVNIIDCWQSSGSHGNCCTASHTQIMTQYTVTDKSWLHCFTRRKFALQFQVKSFRKQHKKYRSKIAKCSLS